MLFGCVLGRRTESEKRENGKGVTSGGRESEFCSSSSALSFFFSPTLSYSPILSSEVVEDERDGGGDGELSSVVWVC